MHGHKEHAEATVTVNDSRWVPFAARPAGRGWIRGRVRQRLADKARRL